MTHTPEDIPIACRLSDAGFREREVTLLAQFMHVVASVVELPHGYAFHINSDEKSLLLAARLMAAERLCCPFLAFELTAQPNQGPVVIQVTGPAGTKEFLRTILHVPELPVERSVLHNRQHDL